VIGTVMQNTPGAQGPHGELTELSVTGAQELAVAADVVALFVALADPIVSKSLITALQGAGAIAAGSIAVLSLREADCDCVVARVVVGAPVSSTFGGTPPPTRVKVNFGHTFSVESNVLKLIVIVPAEAL